MHSQVFFHKLNLKYIICRILKLSTQFPHIKPKILFLCLFVCIGHVVQANRIHRSVSYSIQISSVCLYRENPHVFLPVFFSHIAISRMYGGNKIGYDLKILGSLSGADEESRLSGNDAVINLTYIAKFLRRFLHRSSLFMTTLKMYTASPPKRWYTNKTIYTTSCIGILK